MQLTDQCEMETVNHDPAPEEADILWMDDREVHVLLADGQEAVWPIGMMVEQLQGIQRLQLRVIDGDLDILPVPVEAVLA